MRKPLWLMPVLLLAGCRSEQAALQVLPLAAQRTSTAYPPFMADSALTATVAATRPARVEALAAPARPQSAPRVPRQTAATRPALPLLHKVFSAAPAARRLAQHVRLRHPTEGVAESGLGNIGLFVIGVVLAVLAGLAALVNIIFGVGFFTALGYTAAGLVVLFLLYSLLSGGGSKKKK